MSSLEPLREAVLKRANEEAERLLASARVSAKKIIEEAKERKKAIIEAEKKRAVAEVNFDARIAEAKLRARLLVSKARYELVSRTISQALEVLKTLPPETRSMSLRNLLEEAIKEAESSLGVLSKLVVYVSDKDLELAKGVAEELAQLHRLELELRTTQISGGVIVEDPEGRVRIDNSYDSRTNLLISRISRSSVGEIGL